MNSTAPVITKCGKKYRPASAGKLSLDDLDKEARSLWKIYPDEEEQVLRLRVLRGHVDALPLPQPSQLSEAIDTLLASRYEEMGDLKTRRELEHIIRLALREKVRVRRAGGSAQTLATLTSTVHYYRLELVGVPHNVPGVIRKELSWEFFCWVGPWLLMLIFIAMNVAAFIW
ncbi:hypothetical protein AAY84_23980 [Serratia marcescens]|uniref:hypothetical protein n=1 Tax=Serratia marcescens TaxID=615 RepID=UPI00062C2A93|nr:hypothetical protein [Serratia marcescens]KKZ15844.1 hypothetical protein AAY84_23980 [Serratia marcescens]